MIQHLRLVSRLTMRQEEVTTMPSLEALQDRLTPNFSEYVKTYPGSLSGIKAGIAEYKMGKTRSWEEIKRELGLG